MSVRIPPKNHEFGRIRDLSIPMRDGTILKAQLFLPLINGKPDLSKKYPVMLERSPYISVSPGDDSLSPSFIDYYGTYYGYAVLLCAVRGTNGNEGDFEPMLNEGWGEKQDGIDTIKWILQQPWCNGKIASAGGSYLGAAQTLIQLNENNPGLATSCIFIPALNAGYGNWVYEHGFFTYHLAYLWTSLALADQLMFHKLSPEVEAAVLKENEEFGYPLQNPEKVDLDGWIKKYGLRNMPVVRHVPFWQNWVENYDNQDYFDYNDTSKRSHAIDRALMISGGWYDLFLENTLNLYERLVAEAPSEEVAKGHHLVIAPISHCPTPFTKKFENAATDYESMYFDWTEQQLNGVKCDFLSNAPVHLYVMGEERWRAEQEWPLSDAIPTRFYLNSNGKANSMNGDGYLSGEKPIMEDTDKYIADPAKPIPTLNEHSFTGGSVDHRPNQEREDVLVYTSPVLVEDVEVTGYIWAKLYAATDATDTDFVVKLSDVYPDGTAYNIATGGVRGRYRNDRRNPEALIPGEIVEYDIKMRATSAVFKKGHKIRIEIMSSDAPMWDPNPNRFVDLRNCTEKDYFVANQTIYHGGEHASYVELPIIPESHRRDWVDNWPYAPEVTGGYESVLMQANRERTFIPVELGDILK